ncbi:MAG: hypothetical protein JKY56_07395 [Kofleriaceae bacterium]|nr:hypothetical protein [Kofleriaceae bacterium]
MTSGAFRLWTAGQISLASLLLVSIAGAQSPESDPPRATDQEGQSDASQLFQLVNRHRAIGQVTSLLNTGVDFGSAFYELGEVWKQASADPELRMAWEQLKYQYKPTVSWSAYAGGQVESSGYAGLSLGASLDVVAPLCRYLGAEANGIGFSQDGLGVSYDTRVTACLPWGPFSIEVGVLRQRDLRVGLKSAPSLPRDRYNSDGVEVGIRGFRWFDTTWQGQVMRADVQFQNFSVPNDSSVPKNLSFGIDVSAFQFNRYKAGFLGGDRVYSAFKTTVAGQQENQVAKLSSTVMSISPFTFEGVPIGKALYWDGDIAFVNGSISTLGNAQAPLETRFFFGVDTQVSFGTPEKNGSFRYSRRLLPDSDFRLLAEERAELFGQLLRYDDRASVSLFGAQTKQSGAPPGVSPHVSALSYGAEGQYGRYAFGPFYMQLTTTAARSYYATIGAARLQRPEFEFRALLSLIASDRS